MLRVVNFCRSRLVICCMRQLVIQSNVGFLHESENKIILFVHFNYMASAVWAILCSGHFFLVLEI